MCYFRVQ